VYGKKEHELHTCGIPLEYSFRIALEMRALCVVKWTGLAVHNLVLKNNLHGRSITGEQKYILLYNVGFSNAIIDTAYSYSISLLSTHHHADML